MGYCFEKRCDGGASIELQEKSVTITENTTTILAAGEGKAFSTVEIITAIKQNYCLVRYYNDDRTTLLYEVLVPYGSSAVYAGDAPVSKEISGGIFTGFEPSTSYITADTNCYAVYDEPITPDIPDAPDITTLEAATWADISAISAEGTAANYFAVGDTKTITLSGTIGLQGFNDTYGVYIIGFDHNSELEGNGIHFQLLRRTSDGKDCSLVDNQYNVDNSSVTGAKWFNMHHWALSNLGGWAGMDARYDILGSTDTAPLGYGSKATADRVGYDASATCATNPVPNTVMAALPADLRAVMKPMTKYTDNKGSDTSTDGAAASVTATIDYLPLLSEFEMFGARTRANTYEQNYQEQYSYYKTVGEAGKFGVGKNIGAVKVTEFLRSPAVKMGEGRVCCASPGTNYMRSIYSKALSPIFKV